MSAGVGTEELTAISNDVWACFLDAEGALVPGLPAGGDDVVRASVGISGAWNGMVLLELPTDAATTAAQAMLGAPDVDAEEVADAVGELVNMVGGNLKSLVPAPSTLGLPLVVRGAATVTPHQADEVCAVHLDWAGRPVTVRLWSATRSEEHTP